MEDIFHYVREGNGLQVRLWLDDTEHDLNQGDDHDFSPLHWASKEGHFVITELLIQRGARVNATNKGDDTALHLAASHGHHNIVRVLVKSKADVNMFNEHGNTPLHYACFWGYEAIATDLINAGSLVSATNKYGEKPTDKCKGELAQRLQKLAVETGQDFRKISFNDQSLSGQKTRSRDATLSRNKGINVRDLSLHMNLSKCPCHEMWRGTWQRNDVVVRVVTFRDYAARITRDFNEEFPRLRIFSHPNILPVIGGSADPPYLYIVTQATPYGSLYKILHEGAGLVVDTALALSLAADVARGMAFLHSLDKPIMGMSLNSKHVVIDEERRARISMAHAKFSFEERGKILYPQWMAPEALLKRQSEINYKAADMWSYAILLWELATREVPFSDHSAMEAGMKIALEQLRVSIPPGLSDHMSRLISICMNEDPGKRPTFDLVLPVLDKMKQA